MIFSWLFDKAGSGSESLKLNGSESATVLLEQLTNISIISPLSFLGFGVDFDHAQCKWKIQKKISENTKKI